MKISSIAALFAAFVLATASSATAQQPLSKEALSQLSTPKQFDLNKITCGDFLNLSLSDRGYLLMMYVGYESAKSSTTEFVTAALREKAQKVTDFCAASPKTSMFTAVETSMR